MSVPSNRYARRMYALFTRKDPGARFNYLMGKPIRVNKVSFGGHCTTLLDEGKQFRDGVRIQRGCGDIRRQWRHLGQLLWRDGGCEIQDLVALRAGEPELSDSAWRWI